MRRRGRPDLLAPGRRLAAARPLAKSTAEQIRQALLDRRRRAASWRCCTSTCAPAGAPAASCSPSSDDLVMLNDRARDLLDPADQARAARRTPPRRWPAGAAGRSWSTCPAGVTARMYCRAGRPAAAAGGVVQRADRPPAGARGRADRAAAPSRSRCPAWSAAAPLWLQCLPGGRAALPRRRVARARGRAGRRGRRRWLRAVHQRRHAGGARCACWTPPRRRPATGSPTCAGELADGRGHAGAHGTSTARPPAAARRSPTSLRSPTASRRRSTGRGWRSTLGTARGPARRPRRSCCGCSRGTVERTAAAPPRRGRAELVPLFLARLAPAAATLTCSPEAMRLLMRNRGRATSSSSTRCCAGRWQRRRAGVIGPTTCRRSAAR